MGYEFKITKNMIFMISFLFLFGIILQLSRSHYIVRLNTGNAHAGQAEKLSSALTATEARTFKQDSILLIYDPHESESVALRDNQIKTFDYMKKVYKAVPVSKIPKDLSAYKNVIIAFSHLEKGGDINLFTDYAFKGGKLFFAMRPELTDSFYAIYRKMGIYELADDYEDTNGIKMDSDLLLKSKNLTIDQDFIYNSSLPVHLSEACEVYASSEEGVPLLWSTEYGKGTIMVLNGTMLSDKLNRGIIAGALSYLNDDFIYPIMNSKVVYIDDFPAPFPEGTNHQIYDDYNRDTASFFRDIWWPDIQQIAAKNDVKYTGMLIETYNNRVKGPFEDRLAKENLKIFGRDLIKSGGEIGIHGYNHQSLTENQKQVKSLGYKAWKSEQDMAASLKEAKAFFSELFPNYTLRTYVPPSNVLSDDGKTAIHEAIPSIDTIASLYIKDEENISYIQEYEVNKPFTELPRLTSDYHYNDDSKWMIANSATLFGSFSHFIHPDDILDPDRSNGDDWEELSRQFGQMISDVKTKYPWMKAMTASESADNLKDFLRSQVFISQKQDKIVVYINHFAGKLDFLLRTDKQIKRMKNGTFEKASADRYILHADRDKLEIELEGNQ